MDRVYTIPRMYTSGLQAISNRRKLSVRRSEKGGCGCSSECVSRGTVLFQVFGLDGRGAGTSSGGV